MKKKIALLLATVMLLGIVTPINPVNLLAASTTSVTIDRLTDYYESSVIVDKNLAGTPTDKQLSEIVIGNSNSSNAKFPRTGYEKANLGNGGNGSDLIITFGDDIPYAGVYAGGAQLVVELDNAYFAYYNDGKGVSTYGKGLESTQSTTGWITNLRTTKADIPTPVEIIDTIVENIDSFVGAAESVATTVPTSNTPAAIKAWVEDNIADYIIAVAALSGVTGLTYVVSEPTLKADTVMFFAATETYEYYITLYYNGVKYGSTLGPFDIVVDVTVTPGRTPAEISADVDAAKTEIAAIKVASKVDVDAAVALILADLIAAGEVTVDSTEASGVVSVNISVKGLTDIYVTIPVTLEGPAEVPMTAAEALAIVESAVPAALTATYAQGSSESLAKAYAESLVNVTEDIADFDYRLSSFNYVAPGTSTGSYVFIINIVDESGNLVYSGTTTFTMTIATFVGMTAAEAMANLEGALTTAKLSIAFADKYVDENDGLSNVEAYLESILDDVDIDDDFSYELDPAAEYLLADEVAGNYKFYINITEDGTTVLRGTKLFTLTVGANPAYDEVAVAEANVEAWLALAEDDLTAELDEGEDRGDYIAELIQTARNNGVLVAVKCIIDVAASDEEGEDNVFVITITHSFYDNITATIEVEVNVSVAINLQKTLATSDAVMATVSYDYETYVQRITGKSINAVPYSIYIDPRYPETAYITIDAGTTIYSGDMIVIPMAMIAFDESEDIVANVYNSNPNVFKFDEKVMTVARATTASRGTSAAFKSVVSISRSRVYLSDFVITEKAANVIKEGDFQLQLYTSETGSNTSTGYSLYAPDWSSSSYSFSTVFGLNGYTPTLAVDTTKATDGLLTFTLDGLAPNRSIAGSITIKGLVLAPKSNDPYMFSYSSVYVGIIDVDGDTKISDNPDIGENQRQNNLKAATRSDWNIDYSAATATEIFSGRSTTGGTTRSAVVTIKELTTNSWNALKDTTFTLTDVDGNPIYDAKITRVQLQADNLYQVNGTQWTNRIGSSAGYVAFNNYDLNKLYVGTPMQYENFSFTRDGNSFIITDLSTATGKLAAVALRLDLSINPGWEGEIYLTMSGSSIDDIMYTDVQNEGTQHIATVKSPVKVDVVQTEIQIGYQRYDVGNIVITEQMSSTNYGLTAGNKMQVAIGEYGVGRITDYLYFAPLSKGDITVVGDKTFSISDAVYNYNSKVIEFTVLRGSSTTPAVITLSNLAINVNHSVPKGDYDAIVGGNAVVTNSMYTDTNSTNGLYYPSYSHMYDKFESFGVVNAGYVKVATAGANEGRADQVVLTDGSLTILKNGVEVPMDSPAFIMDGRFYVPLRWASIALGVEQDNIIWDDIARKVVIMTKERVVSFTADSDVMTVNGQDVHMTGTDGVPVYAFINAQTGRINIPASFLSTALQIPWEYDTATGQAIFNPAR